MLGLKQNTKDMMRLVEHSITGVRSAGLPNQSMK